METIRRRIARLEKRAEEIRGEYGRLQDSDSATKATKHALKNEYKQIELQLRYLSAAPNDLDCSTAATSGEQKSCESVLRAAGLNGQIVVSGNTVSIRRDGFFAFGTFGLRGAKEIQISSITSIQFRKAVPFLVRGYIQFVFMGSQDAKLGEFQAAKDENTVLFTPSQQVSFERIKAEIEKRMGTVQKTEIGGRYSDADEIEKLSVLRDKGILTEDEFQTKKRQILGL